MNNGGLREGVVCSICILLFALAAAIVQLNNRCQNFGMFCIDCVVTLLVNMKPSPWRIFNLI